MAGFFSRLFEKKDKKKEQEEVMAQDVSSDIEEDESVQEEKKEIDQYAETMQKNGEGQDAAIQQEAGRYPEEQTEWQEQIKQEEQAGQQTEAEPLGQTGEGQVIQQEQIQQWEQAGQQEEVEQSRQAEQQMEEEKKKGFFSRLVSGLTKTRNSILSGIDSVFHGFTNIDDEFYEELEEILVMADIGIHTTTEILNNLKQKVKEQKIKEPQECRQLLIDSMKEQMEIGENAYEYEHRKSVVLLIGVNGVGKTTSVGKLAGQLKAQKKKVLLAAADTFRAAAIEQLTEWSNRAGVEIIAQKEGSDPAAVVFDAVMAAKARNTDVLLCDTAGRLHNKKNLMEELRKIDRVITREYSDAYRETLVVLDGTTGQNALVQAREFSEVANITGIILTKMDGTAKGGIAIAIQSELGIPVKYIGIGEKIEDLQKFHADAFVDALFAQEGDK